MKSLISEFRGIVWPNKNKVKQEFITVIGFSVLGIIFISIINLLMTGIFSLL